jgi:hypothetical protein
LMGIRPFELENGTFLFLLFSKSDIDTFLKARQE